MNRVYVVVEVYDGDEHWSENYAVYSDKNKAESLANYMNERASTEFIYRVEEHEVIE